MRGVCSIRRERRPLTLALSPPGEGTSRPQQPAAACAGAVGGRARARHRLEIRPAGARRLMARRARRDGALGAPQAHHRRAAHRRLGAAREDRGREPRRHPGGRGRACLAWARAALSRAVRLGRGPGAAAGIRRPGAVPAADALAPARGGGLRQARCRRLHGRVEMGRHPPPGRLRPAPGRAARCAASIRAPARTCPAPSRTSSRRSTSRARSTASS